MVVKSEELVAPAPRDSATLLRNLTESRVPTKLGTLIIARALAHTQRGALIRYDISLEREKSDPPMLIGSASAEIFRVKDFEDGTAKELRASGFQSDDKIGYILGLYPFSWAKSNKYLMKKGIGTAVLKQMEKDMALIGAVGMVVYPLEDSLGFYKKNKYKAAESLGFHTKSLLRGTS